MGVSFPLPVAQPVRLYILWGLFANNYLLSVHSTFYLVNSPEFILNEWNNLPVNLCFYFLSV